MGHYKEFNPYLWDFCTNNSFVIGNFVKYIVRYPYKGQAQSDLNKALDYLRKISYLYEKNNERDNPLININNYLTLLKLESKFNDFQNEIIKEIFYYLNDIDDKSYRKIRRLILDEIEKNNDIK